MLPLRSSKFNTMKKLIIAAIAVVGLASCQQQKIGYVDNSELINEYQEKKDIEAKYKVEIEAFQKKTDSLSKAFQLEYQKASIDAQRMSKSKAEKLALELQSKGQQLQQQLQQEEQLLQKNSQTEMDSLVSKVKREIKSYGEANGYTYILGGGEGGSVLYGKDGKNLTEALLKILNDKYKN